MEIFQTIWTALTTPNEELIYILGFPFRIIESLVTVLLALTFLNIKYSKKQLIIYVSTVSIISFICNAFVTNVINSIINLILIPVLVYFIFKTTILKSIVSEILPMLFISISETISVNLCLSILSVSQYDLQIIPIYKEFIVLFDYLFLFILYVLFKRYSFNITLLDNLNKKTKIILIINSIIGVISIISQLYLIGFYAEALPFFITIIALLSLLAYFFISIYSLSNTTKLALTTTDLEKEKEHNKTLKLLHDELRAFRHDFGNIMTTIGGYAQTGDVEGLKKYYSQIQIDLNRVNNLSTLSPDVINNPAIYSLLAAKYHKADELGIKINLDVFLNLNNLNMKIYEFTRILGILMDNAIEATCECDEKIINLEIRKDMSSPRQLLIIENTYKNKDINIDKIFEKNYSTKPKNSGLGLWEIRQILHKNNNLNLYTAKNDMLFKQQLEIYL